MTVVGKHIDATGFSGIRTTGKRHFGAGVWRALRELGGTGEKLGATKIGRGEGRHTA
jgi:hypothetical protein